MQASTFYSRPSSSFGYWRGGYSDGPLAQGQGSGRGQANSGAGIFPQGSGPAGNGGGAWHPTVMYLLIFVAAEIVAFGLLAKALR
jgi:hypothetical protein